MQQHLPKATFRILPLRPHPSRSPQVHHFRSTLVKMLPCCLCPVVWHLHLQTRPFERRCRFRDRQPPLTLGERTSESFGAICYVQWSASLSNTIVSGGGMAPTSVHIFPSASSSSSSAGVTTPAGLLRRAQGMNSPGFGLASPARYRRASMLGREITPFHLDQEERSDDDDQARNAPSSAAQHLANSRTEANKGDPDDGDDEMMQVEDEDTTVSRAPSTPVMGPPLSLFSTPNTPPPSTASHLPSTRPSMPSSALSRASTSDSGQESSSSTGGGGVGAFDFYNGIVAHRSTIAIYRTIDRLATGSWWQPITLILIAFIQRSTKGCHTQRQPPPP